MKFAAAVLLSVLAFAGPTFAQEKGAANLSPTGLAIEIDQAIGTLARRAEQAEAQLQALAKENIDLHAQLQAAHTAAAPGASTPSPPAAAAPAAHHRTGG